MLNLKLRDEFLGSQMPGTAIALRQAAGHAFYTTPKFTLRGLFEVTIGGKQRVVEYEPDTELRDTEQVPCLECAACPPVQANRAQTGGQPGYIPTGADAQAVTEAFLRREVPPYAPDLPAPSSPRQAGVSYKPDSVKLGYEVSFNRYFYTPKALRPLEEIRAELLAVEREAKGLLEEILGNFCSIIEPCNSGRQAP